MEEKMKDSGIKWIGQIPESWDIVKIKYNVNIFTGNSIADNDKENYEDCNDAIPYIATKDINVNSNKIDYKNGMYIKKDDKSFKRAPGNSSLLCIEGGSAGRKVAFTDKTVCFVNKLCCFTSRSMDNKFLFYTLNSYSFKEAFNQNIFGLIGGVSTEKIKNIKITVPSIEEQKQIAKFLDKKCADIDEIISKTEEQIEVLEKYKKSLIREIVTKGLNKNVELKNSGIQWIGNIPKEWDIYNLKHLFRMYAGGDVDEYDLSNTFSQETPYPIYSNSLEKNGLLGYMSKYRFKGKTFTVTGRGDVGKAIARNDSYFPVVRLLVCVPMFGDDTRYFTYCVNSADLFGDQTAMAQLTTQRLGLNKFPRPTFIEQKKISDFLDVECQKINEVITKQKESLETLKKYKQSLIYEYVTGKKRV